MSLSPGNQRALAHVILAFAALLIVLPFAWITVASFKNEIDIATGAVVFNPVLSNYRELLASRSSTFLNNYGNSFIIACCSTLLSLSAGTLAAYSIHRLRWPAWVRHVFLGWSMFYYMTPQITLIGSWYVMFRAVGLNNTLLAVILTHATIFLPMAIWLMSNYLQDVPRELEEAASVDGCHGPRILFRIVLPLVAPGLMATATLLFVFSWNELPIALALTARETATVPVAIARFSQDFEIKHGPMAAGAVLSAVPALLVMSFALRYVVRGLTAGALK